MTQSKERRKDPRTEVSWPIQILAEHGTIEGEAKNISPEGIFICCDEPLPLNETFRLSISPPEHDSFGVAGKVIWSDFYGLDENKIPVCMGICFIEIPAQDSQHLKDLISINI